MWLFTNPEFDKLNIGDVMTVFSTLFWAFYITCMDLFTKGETDFAKTAQLTALPFITASIPPLITYFLFDLALPAPSFTPNLFLALGFNGIIASFFLTFMHTSFQRYTTPVKASLIFSLEPVFASLLAMLFYNEMLHNREWTGASILMAGVLLSETGHLMFGRIRS
jgi:drug/metabolite transporter (DMT)-like permease